MGAYMLNIINFAECQVYCMELFRTREEAQQHVIKVMGQYSHWDFHQFIAEQGTDFEDWLEWLSDEGFTISIQARFIPAQ